MIRKMAPMEITLDVYKRQLQYGKNSPSDPLNCKSSHLAYTLPDVNKFSLTGLL